MDGSKLLTTAIEHNIDGLEQHLKKQDVSMDISYGDKRKRNCLHYLFLGEPFSDMNELRRGLQVLKSNGADINLRDHLSNTPLHLAFSTYRFNTPTVIEMTLEIFFNFDWNLKDSDGYTLFHMFMSYFPDWIKERDDAEKIMQRTDEFISRLLTGKVPALTEEMAALSLNSKEKSGYTAFQTYLEGENHNAETVALMIQKGADINNSSNLGITSLMQVCLRRKDDLVKMFLENGADPNRRDIFGQSAIFRVRSVESFQQLVKHGADINIIDRSGRVPIANFLFHVPQNHPIEGLAFDDDLSEYPILANLFFDQGLNINVADRYGSTLLHYAAWWSPLAPITNLIERNALVDVRDNFGLTPYDLALHHGNYNILPLLKSDKNCKTCVEKEHDFKEIKDRIGQLSSVCINEVNLDDVKNVFDMFHIKENSDELLELLLLVPNFGMVNRKLEAKDIIQTVNDIMKRAAEVLCEIDFRFRASIKPTGSSSEGTMVGDPGEFDFVFCLEYFSQECIIIQPDDLLHTGFTKLVIAENRKTDHPLEPFETHEGFINIADVRILFQDLMVQALNRCVVWEHEGVYFDGLVKFPNDKPILNIIIGWNGPTYKQLTISVDIVPAVYKAGWFPREIEVDRLIICSEKVKKSGFFVLLHGPDTSDADFESHARISSACMEIEFFKSSPEIIREIYATCKILKNHSFCPTVQFDDNQSNESIESSSSVQENELISLSESKIEDDKDNNNTEFQKTHAPRETFRWIAIHDEKTRKIVKLYTPKVLSENNQIATNSRQQDVKSENEDTKIIYSRRQNSNQSGKTLDGSDLWGRSLERQEVIVQNREGSMKRPFENNSETGQKKRFEFRKYIQSYEGSCSEEDIKTEPTSSVSVEEANIQSILGLLMDTEIEGGDIVEADDCITSYMLKNCLLHVKSEYEKQNHGPVLSKLKMTTEIYKYLLQCSKKRHLPAYCMPFVNIFSYVNEHIRLLEEDEREALLHESCYRIACFCKIILGMLELNNKDNTSS